mmetsp:Transcript_4157/g.9677  ORF Transcript_4157/g.9677 Transcript_4157/m.9677 type:complete len:210 (-) Transcript_4157:253-882(-)
MIHLERIARPSKVHVQIEDTQMICILPTLGDQDPSMHQKEGVVVVATQNHIDALAFLCQLLVIHQGKVRQRHDERAALVLQKLHTALGMFKRLFKDHLLPRLRELRRRGGAQTEDAHRDRARGAKDLYAEAVQVHGVVEDRTGALGRAYVGAQPWETAEAHERLGSLGPVVKLMVAKHTVVHLNGIQKINHRLALVQIREERATQQITR